MPSPQKLSSPNEKLNPNPFRILLKPNINKTLVKLYLRINLVEHLKFQRAGRCLSLVPHLQYNLPPHLNSQKMATTVAS